MKYHAKWYNRRLAKYFVEHYEAYENTAEYWPDPEINQWLFDIYELGIRVELTCDDKGNVYEQQYYLKDWYLWNPMLSLFITSLRKN